MTKECAIIDTCVLLSDPDVVVRAAQIGFPVVTKTVFDEIDYNKKNSNIDAANNAKLIFRKIKHQTPEQLDALPCGKALRDGDTLYKYEFGSAPLFVLTRDHYKTKRNNFNDINTYNDATIREVAKDYDLILVTEDGGNKTLADLDGIRAAVWVPRAKNRRVQKTSRVPSSPSVQPFRLATSVTPDDHQVRQSQATPREGDTITLGRSGPSAKLARQIGAGGEGQVFELAGDNRVAKIYHRDQLTANRIAKLELMASRTISRDGICWPEKLVYASDGSPVGYVMQKAQGYPLQKSLFVKPLLSQRFPRWQRENLVNVCLSFLERMQYLHALNVLVGDINPMNVLVDGDGSSIFIVDTDSFQVEGFPCPVGTVNFSPPHLQHKNFKTLLRTEDDELFAIATMLFMTLVPGKPPYSQQGGESPERNIVDGNFPYPFGEDHRSNNVAAGPWRYIWSHLSFKLKELFHKSFRNNERIPISDWMSALRDYKGSISAGHLSNEIFPLGFKVPKGKGIEVTCSAQGCGKTFEMHQDRLNELRTDGKKIFCPDCRQRMELERLVRTSSAANKGNMNRAAPPRRPKSIFSQLGGGGASKPHRPPISQRSWPFQHSHAKARKQNTTSEPGTKWVVALIAAVLLLSLEIGWWIAPVILGGLVILGFLSGKIPR